MNPHHLLLATMALLLMDILEDAECNPTISSRTIESLASQIDDVDMTLLHRAMRQGNDCDSQVSIAKYLLSPRQVAVQSSLLCPYHRRRYENCANDAPR